MSGPVVTVDAPASNAAVGGERRRILPTPGRRVTRARDWLRGSAAGVATLAVVTGAGAGAGAVGFRYLIELFTWLFTGRNDFSDAGRVASTHLLFLGPFFVLAVPAFAGLVYGPVVNRFAREARGHGVPEVMLAVAEKGGRIPPPVAVVKSLASALCIGSGGSVGREGPIVQIGSALGSTIGQRFRLPESRLRLLVACGAAGGISATFNAPIAGVFFALELILRDFETESFGAVVLASVTSAVIGRAAFGNQPFLALPAFQVRSPLEFVFYAVLGLLAALAGVGFTRILYAVEDVCDRVWAGRPEWARPAVGGLLLGVLLLALPQMYGVGYPVLQKGIGGGYVAWFLLVLLAGKMIATSLTIGIGGSGGVFAPSLFMGAMLGTAFGDAIHAALPHLTAPAGAYGLVGMGAVFAGAARAPITAVIIIFELTGDYSIVLPLMTAIVLAAAMSSRVSKDTIYTLKLRRRGIELSRGRPVNLMEVLKVADAMQSVPPTLPAATPLDVIIERLASEGRESLPVVDEEGVYRGTVTSREVEQSARDNALDTTAADLARALPGLSPTTSLHDALTLLASHEGSGVPVLSPSADRLIGWVHQRDVLRAYAARLQRGARAATSTTQTRDTAAAGDGEHLGDFRIVELKLTDQRAPVGMTVGQVRWPPASHLLALRRDGQAVPVTPQTRLSHGDRLTLLLAADWAGRAADAIHASTAVDSSSR